MKRPPHPVMAELARHRRERGLSQAALGRRLHLTFQAISWRETGRTSPGLNEVDAQARALGLRIVLVPLERKSA